MEGRYKLISCGNPSKTPHNLKSRFAKLTLSSRSEKVSESNAHRSPMNKKETVLSGKKLFDDLLTEDESDCESELESSSEKNNRLFRNTDKIQTIFDEKNEKDEEERAVVVFMESSEFTEKLRLTESDIGQCSFSDDKRESSVEMERLQVTNSQMVAAMPEVNSEELFSQYDKLDAVQALSAQIGSLVLLSPKKVDMNIRPEANINVDIYEKLVDAGFENENNSENDDDLSSDILIVTVSSTVCSPLTGASFLSKDDENEADKSCSVIVLSDSESSEDSAFYPVSNTNMNQNLEPEKKPELSNSAKNRLNFFFEKCQGVSESIRDDPIIEELKENLEDQYQGIEMTTDKYSSEEFENYPQSNNESKLNDYIRKDNSHFIKQAAEDSRKNESAFNEQEEISLCEQSPDKYLHDSVLNETNQSVCSVNDSIEIMETSEEDEDNRQDKEQNENDSLQQNEEQNDKTLPTPEIESEIENSLSSNSQKSSDISDDTNKYIESINISTKIKIKVQISELKVSTNEMRTPKNDESNVNVGAGVQNEGSAEKNLNEEQINKSNTEELACENCAKTKCEGVHEAIYVSTDSMPQTCAENPVDVPAEAEFKSPVISTRPARILSEAERRVLDQIYGEEWRTPEIIKHTRKATLLLNKTNKTCNDTTFLGDFSSFHNNIKADLESTRLSNRENIVKNQENNWPKPKILTPAPKYKVKRPGQEIHERLKNLCDNSDSSSDENNKSKSSVSKVKSQKKIANTDKRLEDSDSLGSAHVFKKPVMKEISSTNPSSSTKFNTTRSGRTCRKRFSKIYGLDDSEEEDKNNSDSSSENSYERISRKPRKNNSKDSVVYLDLTSDVVSIQEECTSPEANHDDNFNERLERILSGYKYVEKPKFCTPQTTEKTRRKLFTPKFGYEDEEGDNVYKQYTFEKISSPESIEEENVKLKTPIPFITPLNKKLEAVKRGTPTIGKNEKGSNKKNSNSNQTTPLKERNDDMQFKCKENDFNFKRMYGFLASLDVAVSKQFCDHEALYYRENYRNKKDELVQRLYRIYNENIFDNKLNVEIKWNKKLLNTAGRCTNKKKGTVRTSYVELSEKVLTSADRLRCTLIHELCHAATWIFDNATGHGAVWKAWAAKATRVFPELPKIGVCHQYDIEYKYTYKCTLCNAKSQAHSKSKKVENIRCSYCHGAIEIFLNKRDKEGNVTPQPLRTPNGFAKFVKENYKKYRKPEVKHADVMKILSAEFANVNVNGGVT